MKRFLLLAAMILAPPVALAQGNTTLIRALPEPLPSCTPSTQPFQPQPIVWDITAQAIKNWRHFGQREWDHLAIFQRDGKYSDHDATNSVHRYAAITEHSSCGANIRGRRGAHVSRTSGD